MIAMNKGIDVASGEWINFMNAGDGFYNNEVLSSLFVRNKYELEKYSVIYGDVIVVYDEFDLKVVQKAKDIQEIFKGMPFCHQSCFVKKTDIEYFDCKFGAAADFNLIFKLYIKEKLFKKSNIIISKYRAFGYSDKIDFGL